MLYMQGFIRRSWGVIQNPSSGALEGAKDRSASVFPGGDKAVPGPARLCSPCRAVLCRRGGTAALWGQLTEKDQE